MVTRGIAGTRMQARDLPVKSVWQLVTFLKDSVARNASTNNGSNELSVGVTLPELHATFERIKDAGKNPGDWLTYSATYNAQRHSRLSQVTRNNVAHLRLKWLFQFPKLSRGVECTPIVVGHSMFVTLPHRDVWPLDTRTVDKMLSYSYPISLPLTTPPY